MSDDIKERERRVERLLSSARRHRWLADEYMEAGQNRAAYRCRLAAEADERRAENIRRGSWPMPLKRRREMAYLAY